MTRPPSRIAANDAAPPRPADNGQYTVTLSQGQQHRHHDQLHGHRHAPPRATTSRPSPAASRSRPATPRPRSTWRPWTTRCRGQRDGDRHARQHHGGRPADLDRRRSQPGHGHHRRRRYGHRRRIAANDADASETGPDNGQYTVTLSKASSTDTTIAYTVTGTAASGDDFTPLSGSVTITAGNTTAAIDLPPWTMRSSRPARRSSSRSTASRPATRRSRSTAGPTRPRSPSPTTIRPPSPSRPTMPARRRPAPTTASTR